MAKMAKNENLAIFGPSWPSLESGPQDGQGGTGGLSGAHVQGELGGVGPEDESGQGTDKDIEDAGSSGRWNY